MRNKSRKRLPEKFTAPRVRKLVVGDNVETVGWREGIVVDLIGGEVRVSMHDTCQIESFSSGNLRYIPTPSEIVRLCSVFQGGWTDVQRAKHLVVGNPEATIPVWEANEFEASMIA